jgi:hypothetical protein
LASLLFVNKQFKGIILNHVSVEISPVDIFTTFGNIGKRIRFYFYDDEIEVSDWIQQDNIDDNMRVDISYINGTKYVIHGKSIEYLLTGNYVIVEHYSHGKFERDMRRRLNVYDNMPKLQCLMHSFRGELGKRKRELNEWETYDE